MILQFMKIDTFRLQNVVNVQVDVYKAEAMSKQTAYYIREGILQSVRRPTTDNQLSSLLYCRPTRMNRKIT